jgi:hypothetical protein
MCNRRTRECSRKSSKVIAALVGSKGIKRWIVGKEKANLMERRQAYSVPLGTIAQESAAGVM